MKTFSQQNPVTVRIDKMCEIWSRKVTGKKFSAVRWLVQHDEEKMLDAFSILETTEHSQLPDLFIRLDTDMDDYESYDKLLFNDWLKNWESPESVKSMKESGVVCTFDTTPWKERLKREEPFPFLECMNEFARSIKGFKDKVVVFLKPLTFQDEKLWIKWIHSNIDNGIPPRVRLMVMDRSGLESFKNWNNFNDSITLTPELNMGNVAREMNATGDQNNPAVQFNTCIFNLGDGLARKNSGNVHHWGKKAFEIALKDKNIPLQVAACITYGAALFQLKDHKGAIEQFSIGRERATAGKASGVKECDSLLLQTIMFLGAVNFHKKENKIAFSHYQEMCEMAIEQNNYFMAMDGLYMSYLLADKLGKYSDSISYLNQAFEIAKSAGFESLKYSSLMLVCENLYKHAINSKNQSQADEIDNQMKEMWGEQWKNIAIERANDRKNYKSGLFANFNFFKKTN